MYVAANKELLKWLMHFWWPKSIFVEVNEVSGRAKNPMNTPLFWIQLHRSLIYISCIYHISLQQHFLFTSLIWNICACNSIQIKFTTCFNYINMKFVRIFITKGHREREKNECMISDSIQSSNETRNCGC